ncbi:bifunctional 4-hydroxy-2-oxoglutarate aldolase/2-dehydro-3-deoxy-phosphogluconate aldolase [Oligoflexus tunisiensis]|uniref:bifunctional 4-hydroxy-2-oxoglutarate aldolase/2-dehydro-3-deoxy-phosphogluconate aldolase n=1 Tax=Oligoflexus tunisiensis TaxID=708132 RepID=UPI00114D0667|nr:bifunctional 4-hydroxy-2-oxoglutarate aldolase/2-dehydro-3-deoxy-phosphogluconate aldolase [Oligoflexus tunisiensis]
MKTNAAHRMLDILKHNRLLLAVTLHAAEDWQGLGELLEHCQLQAVEIMLRTPYAWDGVRLLRKHWPQLTIGVGTVLEPDDLKRAHDIGAGFAVSPGTESSLLDAAQKLDLPYLPGVTTASDLMQVARTPLRAVKFFPAAALGAAYLQALAAPFADFRFCVSGGLEVGNHKQFLKARQVLALSGSWPLPKNLSDPHACGQALPYLKQLCSELSEAFPTENPPSPTSTRL